LTGGQRQIACRQQNSDAARETERVEHPAQR
jgi:hypothetical protein